MMALLSDRIDDASKRHRKEYPDGDWQSVNDEFSDLFFEAMPILLAAGIDPIDGGNEGRAKTLRRLGY